MTWQIKDEWIDMAQGAHIVVYHNPEVMVDAGDGKKSAQEHHLIHQFTAESCPTCGQMKERSKRMMAKFGGGVEEDPGVDFHKVKADTLEALHNHHSGLMDYRSKHPNVRIGTGPSK